jgi:hypothetical protein
MTTLIDGIKNTKTVEIDVMYRNTIKAGYLSTYNIRIDCGDDDIAYWYTGLQLYTKNNMNAQRIKSYSILEVYNFTDVGLLFEFYSTKETKFIVEELSRLIGKNKYSKGSGFRRFY